MTERTVLYIVGAGALWYVLTKRQTARSAAESKLVTFPPISATNLDDLFCSPASTYGGWRESSKVAEAERLYLEKWGFNATVEFVAAVKQRNPCEPRHIQALIDAYPPFPGQTFTEAELAEIRKRQAESRETKRRQAEEAARKCIDTVTGASAAVGTAVAAVAAGVVTGGTAVVPAAGAGGTAGGAFGRFLSGIWC